MAKMPTWKPPKDIAKALEDGDGSWEDERWSPILLTASTALQRPALLSPSFGAEDA
jgi:hypothetical protein